MRNAISLCAGLIFGLGICLSGLSQPHKVLGFLDLAGNWDPSLAFVMAGAIAVAAPAFALARRRGADWTGEPLQLPRNREIDAPLVLGSAIFGVGWGLAGLCPGPALVGVGFFSPLALAFVAAMAVGVLATRRWRLWASRRLPQDA
jgi:uncharacterized membrane protein YedE/YeeE